ncbi:acyltransferase family protein [Sinomonas gamaensis]|uniref:acyltransferase family protein n=1 Tax=Sinomonas gamaensis TaxID=2565624 RepID=UPI0011082F93|nr:acyltransferase [Sinomonas gamaensis]
MGETALVAPGMKRLNLPLTASLNTARALAAIYVVCHHLVMTSGWSGAWTNIFRFGQEAVIVFFLLSGFLIFHAEHGRVSDARGYYLRRLRRIYPALMCALMISIIIAGLNGTIVRDFNIWALLGNIAALQDVSALKPGVVVDGFLGNSPLWSLSYEVFFYLMFPLVITIYSRIGRGRTLAIIATASVIGYASYLVFPNHLSLVCAYFSVWWGGAYLADIRGNSALSIRGALPVIAALLALSIAALLGVFVFGLGDPGVFPMLPLRHFVFASACIALCASPVGVWLVRAGAHGGSPAAFVASISYGLYVFHYPVLIQWRGARTPTGLIVGLIVLIAAAYICDRKLDLILPKPRPGGWQRRDADEAEAPGTRVG